jgi:hypothetical protein
VNVIRHTGKFRLGDIAATKSQAISLVDSKQIWTPLDHITAWNEEKLGSEFESMCQGEEKHALLVYYAASTGTDVSEQTIGSIFKGQELLLSSGLFRSDWYSLHLSPEEGSSHQLRGGILKTYLL